jgi:hypothetical protein
LNTRIFNDYASGFTHPQVRQPIAKNPGQLCQMLTHPTHQHARPNTPKPIHPDKEQFCSSTTKLGANIRILAQPTFAGTANQKSETRISP